MLTLIIFALAFLSLVICALVRVLRVLFYLQDKKAVQLNLIEIYADDETKAAPCIFGNIVTDHACYCHHKRTKMRKCSLWRMFGDCPGDWHKGKWSDGKCPYFRIEEISGK